MRIPVSFRLPVWYTTPEWGLLARGRKFLRLRRLPSWQRLDCLSQYAGQFQKDLAGVQTGVLGSAIPSRAVLSKLCITRSIRWVFQPSSRATNGPSRRFSRVASRARARLGPARAGNRRMVPRREGEGFGPEDKEESPVSNRAPRSHPRLANAFGPFFNGAIQRLGESDGGCHAGIVLQSGGRQVTTILFTLPNEPRKCNGKAAGKNHSPHLAVGA
ncbi:MAG: hypothetical protein JWO94_767 [Verrucomicrobiaceae bacterium]|nr:hypothetical protein [Verrucomicrobiaceae bacterium]